MWSEQKQHFGLAAGVGAIFFLNSMAFAAEMSVNSESFKEALSRKQGYTSLQPKDSLASVSDGSEEIGLLFESIGDSEKARNALAEDNEASAQFSETVDGAEPSVEDIPFNISSQISTVIASMNKFGREVVAATKLSP